MTFKVDFGYGQSKCVSTEKNGRVCFSVWSSKGLEMSLYPTTHNGVYYRSCISILDIVADNYPEVYRAVYDHIQGRHGAEYSALKAYCKKRNNELASKLSIIE